ncbi:MAG: amino acid adenylation domain-containing protein, partial [Chloroflexi bacterium]|nr:amino acid adenylation domain-containing protein [Chloroflexota bacterium]
ALRTTFQERDGQAWQVIAPTLGLDLVEQDLRAATDDPNATAQALAAAEAVRPFELARGPLIRAQLVRLATDEWLLLVTLHHSIADGWSMDVLLRELAQGYRAQVTGTSAALPTLPIQYADYAVWQRDWLQGAIVAQQLAYWQRELADAPTVLALPTDHPRPSRPSLAGAVAPLALSPALTTALRQYSQGAHATTFMTLLAAFAVVLARHSGQAEVVIGVPVAGRTRPETAGLIGFFVNMLPLRVRVGQARSFGELVAAVRTAALAAYAQQDLPFELLVEALTPERSLHHAPLVQVACTLRQAGAELELSGVTVRRESIPHTTAKLDLTLNLAETSTGLAGGLEYSTELFAPATIARLAGHVVQVLDHVLAAPDAPLLTLPLLTAPEYQQLVHDRNATYADYPADQCIHELVAARAAQMPAAIALVCGEQELTYQVLDRRANQLAHLLRQRGVGSDVCVGLCLLRSLDLVVAQLAVLKAGGAFLPLDPAAPSERSAYILHDAQVALLLTTESALSIAPPDDVAVLWLDRDAALLDDAPTEPLDSVVTPANLAYVIYTSGSTGRPKGVAVPHAGLVNLASWHQRAYSLSATDRATLIASPAFDASVWEIWPYLVSGARIVIPDEATRSDPAALAAWLCRQAITISFLPTALAEAVMAQPWPAVTALRALLVGGDQLHPIADDLPFPVYNHYGPTETTVVASWQRVELDSAGKLPPIGRPIANTQAYLLDAQLNPVPIGVVGELYVGGVGVARGYVHQPALTAERFIPHPFATKQTAGTRLYRTGDLARWLPDGSIEFGGRIDHQVKLRGFRIELGEIEAAPASHPDVREAVVIVREDMGDPRLVAYVVENKGTKEQRNKDAETTTPPSPITTEVEADRGLGKGGRGDEGLASILRAFLKDRLPTYMIPSAFVVLDALPLTSNGKLDRRALPQPELSHADPDETPDTPRTPAEDLVANIWANVLGVEQVSLHANFFELGGHSLLATQVISQIRRIFQIELPLSTVFEAPTVAEL